MQDPSSPNSRNVQININAQSLEGGFRIGRIVLPLILLLLFFLPWTKLSCGQMTLGTQSGAQLLMGGLSPSEQFTEQLQRTNEESQKDDNSASQQVDNIKKEWMAGIYVIGLTILFLGAIRALKHQLDSARSMQWIGAGLMLVSLLVMLIYGFRMERELEAQMGKGEASPKASNNDLLGDAGDKIEQVMGRMLRIEVDWGFTTSLGVLVLFLLMAGADRFVNRGAPLLPIEAPPDTDSE